MSHPPLPAGAEAIELLILDADGVLTDGTVWVDDQGGQMRRYSIRDGLAIGAWQRLGFTVAIVSGRRGADLEERARALGVDEVVQGVEDKAQAVKDLLGRLGVAPSRAAFLGDDVQDTPGMAEVGLAMAVADAEAPCLAAAAWVTRRPGGSGAVRDAIEALIEARGLTERAMMLMSRPRASGRIGAGLLVAIVMAVVFAAMVGFFVLRAGGDGDERRDTISNTNPPVIGREDDLGSVWHAEIPIADRERPDRLAAMILFEQSNPAGQPRTYDIVAPQAYIYLENGQTLHVQGESGRFIMASRSSPPERGTIRGDVIVRLFDSPEGKAADGEELDVLTATPVLTARTEALHFDANRGELTNDELITVESPRYEFAASGVSALFDQASRRLLKLEFARGERLTYFPPPQTEGALEAGADAAVADEPEIAAAPEAAPPQRGGEQGAAASPKGAGPAPEPPAQEAAAPVETLYHAVFRDEVVLSQEGRQLTADQLDVWTRLQDNKLPEGAIGSKNLPEASVGLAIDPLTLAVAGAMAQAGPGSGPGPEAGRGAGGPALGAEAPITLTWTGPLSVLPIVGPTPVELADANHLSLRFTASRTGQVRFSDEELGATGFCQALAYRATDQILTLWGIGERSGAALRAPGMGEIRGGRIEMNVATLMATIPGSGMLISLGEARGEPGGEVTWGERAEFRFRSRPQDRAPEAIAIESALFRGNVEADTPDGEIHAETLQARFDPPGVEDDRPRLRHLSARREPHSTTRILARSEQEGEIRCDALDVWFAAEGGARPRAERLLAVGAVEASGRDSSLTASRLDAALVADDRGRAIVEKAEMSGAVVLVGRDADGLPVRARGEEITAWPERQRAILVGSEAARAHVARDGTSIEAAQLELDGSAGFVSAFGAGELRHALRHAQRDRRGALVATWTQQLELDDESGEADLHGDVVATVTRPMEEDRIAAEVVSIRFTPRSEVSAEVKAAAASGLALGEVEGAESAREFLSLAAIGATLAGERDELARIRSGRWLADGAAAGGRRLVSLLSLEGPRIEVDAVDGTLDVPGAGRLLMLDHRERGDEGGAGSAGRGASDRNPLDPAGAAHGATLINWEGSMRMERASGRLDIERTVLLSHKPSPDDPQMNLDCERLEALIRETAPGRAADQFQGELISAEAFGAVWVESSGRELVAERLTYNAITRDLEATAPSSAVIMHDGGRAVTGTASRVLWNLATDRVRIEEPGSVTAPAPGAK